MCQVERSIKTMLRKFVTLGAVVLVALSSVSAQSCARSYTIQPGDYCNGISASQHVSSFQLSYSNPSLDCGSLRAGQSICLGLSGKDCQTTQVISSGQTCASIISSAGISLQTLHANNPNVNADCSNIYPGEVLCTSSSVIGY
ncbi:hypothetical protein PNOK_0866600 [Pyrrhoderma noxium]|uniref:LysM domain-containing protein n=1 Tax=Pyrrhoderma noxium TaxID=2282107 RepID=A0A286U8B1_9AGAM|nr:hypothetical protein PNOK_0866600 [Pyrrhoderma noxium]